VGFHVFDLARVLSKIKTVEFSQKKAKKVVFSEILQSFQGVSLLSGEIPV